MWKHGGSPPLAAIAEVCRSQSTGVDSNRSYRFSTGAGPGVDIFD